MADLFHRRRAGRRGPPEGTAPGQGSRRPGYGGEPAQRGEPPRHGTVAEATRPRDDLSTHPDAEEMRARHDRILGGHDVALMDAPVFLIGLYCAVSPWILHFTTSQPALVVHNVVLGIAVAVLGWSFAQRPHRMYGLSWAMCAIGTWLIISPWIVGSHPDKGIIISNAIIGGLTALMGLLCAAAAAKARRGRARAPASASTSASS